MSLMTILVAAWAVLTAALVILLIYRGTLSMHEDDQLFLDDNSASLRIEQEQLLARMKKVTPWVRICGVLSVVLIIAVAALWVINWMHTQTF